MPTLGGINPKMVPIISTPIPMNPVVNHTSALTKMITPITICCNGIAACKRSIPLPTTRMIGIAINPAATVMAISLTKSAVGSAEDHVSIGYIILSAKVAPDLERPIIYKKPRTITVTAVLTAERIAFGDELGWYDYLRNIIFFLLLGISFLLLATETTRLDWPKWMRKLSMNKLATDSRFAGFLAATGFFLLSGFYGWAVFSLPARSPVGIPDASLLLPSLAGLFGIANLLDIYATTSHIPPQNEDWTLPPAKPLIVPCFWSGVAGASMGVLPGMTASQATVLVMGGRNVAAKVQGKEGYGMDWETRRLTEMTDEELLEIALSEAEGWLLYTSPSPRDRTRSRMPSSA